MKRISTETIFSNSRLSVAEAEIERSDGLIVRRVIVDAGEAVCVIALRGSDEDQEIALISQPREVIGRERYLELPAGQVDAGEDALAAAVRELAEETGLEAGSWEELGEIHPTVGYSCEVIYLFVARELSEDTSGASADDDEQISLIWRRLAELDLDEIEDAKSLAALARLAWRLDLRLGADARLG